MEGSSAEEGAGPTRHEVERGVGEITGSGAGGGLGEGDRFAVDVGLDLFGGARGAVHDEGVMVPLAGARPGEEDVVAGGAVADGYAELAGFLGSVGIDQEAAGEG